MSKKPTVPLVDDIFHVTAVDSEKKVFKSGMLKIVIFLFLYYSSIFTCLHYFLFNLSFSY